MKVGIYAYLMCEDGTPRLAYACVEGAATWIPRDAATVFRDQNPVSLLEIEVQSDDGNHRIKQGWGS